MRRRDEATELRASLYVVIVVRYSGPTRGLYTLVKELSAEGLSVEYEPPQEQRGVGQDIVHVLIQVGSDAEAGLIGAGALAAVQRIAQAFRERHPQIEADVDPGEEDSDDGSE